MTPDEARDLLDGTTPGGSMTTNDADHVSESNAHLIAAAADIARRITGDQARAARQALEEA